MLGAGVSEREGMQGRKLTVMGWISIFLLPMVKAEEEEGFRSKGRERESKWIYISILFSSPPAGASARGDRHLGVM